MSKRVDFSEFLKDFKAYWPKFIAHHNDAKWHDDDFVSLRTLLPPRHVALVIDYAENYSHQPRFEHQSKYFSQVQTTVVPVVVMLRVEDLVNVTDEEKTQLLKILDDQGQPRVVSETHYLISSDMHHDNAFVQKGLDDHIIPYIRTAAPNTTSLHVRSDGCKVMLKLCPLHCTELLTTQSADALYWLVVAGAVQVCCELQLGIQAASRRLWTADQLEFF